MEVKNIKFLMPYMFLNIPIGVGTTAVCFLRPNKEVLKLYYNSYNTRELFERRDMLEHLKFLATLTNDIYDGPKDIYVKNNKVLGYSYPYINMPTLKRMPENTTYLDIIQNYRYLIRGVKEISEKHFVLSDVHHKNILFKEYYKIIDIDKGYIDLDTDVRTIYINNMSQITRVIIEQIFDLKIYEHLVFEDEMMQKYFQRTLDGNPYEIYEFMGRLFHNREDKYDVKKNVRIKVYKEDPSYHQMF